MSGILLINPVLPLTVTNTPLNSAILANSSEPIFDEHAEAPSDNSDTEDSHQMMIAAFTPPRESFDINIVQPPVYHLDQAPTELLKTSQTPQQPTSLATPEHPLDKLVASAKYLFGSAVGALDDFFGGLMPPSLAPAFSGAGKSAVLLPTRFMMAGTSDGALHYTEQDKSDYLTVKKSIEIRKMESELVACIKQPDGSTKLIELNETQIESWLNQLQDPKSDLNKNNDQRNEVVCILAKAYTALTMKFVGISLVEPLLSVVKTETLPLSTRLLALDSEQIREIASNPTLKHVWEEFNGGLEITPSTALDRATPTQTDTALNLTKIVMVSWGIGWGSFLVENIFQSATPYTNWGIGIGISLYVYAVGALISESLKETNETNKSMDDTKDETDERERLRREIKTEVKTTFEQIRSETNIDAIIILKAKIKGFESRIDSLQEKAEKSDDEVEANLYTEQTDILIDFRNKLKAKLAEIETRVKLTS